MKIQCTRYAAGICGNLFLFLFAESSQVCHRINQWCNKYFHQCVAHSGEPIQPTNDIKGRHIDITCGGLTRSARYVRKHSMELIRQCTAQPNQHYSSGNMPEIAWKLRLTFPMSMIRYLWCSTWEGCDT